MAYRSEVKLLEGSREEIEKKINKALEEGWILYGELKVVQRVPNGSIVEVYFFQLVTRVVKEKAIVRETELTKADFDTKDFKKIVKSKENTL